VQLAMKFLEREELGHYHTQTEFFKPFESIMKHAKSGVIREFALKAIEQMIRARAKSIKSGWKSIFLIYSRYAHAHPPSGSVCCFACAYARVVCTHAPMRA
jgi:brefeldin A-inhibited guanine nucleotide-exchange protein